MYFVSLRAVCISTNVVLPSLVTSVRTGGVWPSSVQVATTGCQSLMEQNGPITAHTASGVPLTSTLRESEAADARGAAAPMKASKAMHTKARATLEIKRFLSTMDMAVFLCLPAADRPPSTADSHSEPPHSSSGTESTRYTI